MNNFTSRHITGNINTIYSEVQSSIREIKIKIVLNDQLEDPFVPSISKLKWGDKRFRIFPEKWWPIIKSWKGKSIITGSLSLYAHGLLDRQPNDIDLIADELIFKEHSKLIGEKVYENRYPGMENKIEILGYFTHKNYYNVDFFKLESQKFREVEGFLFHDPFEVLLIKTKLYEINNQSKDRQDLFNCLDNIWRLV
jgi:hypothetical protein